MIKLKIDLHTHNAEDFAEIIAGTQKMLSYKEFIDMALKKGFDAISFTHHGIMYSEEKALDYAKKKGLLLIPGVETYIQGKHVLIINDVPSKFLLTFDELRKYKTDSNLIIAPHPFFKTSFCLGHLLLDHIDCFDAIEYCHFYSKYLNLNKRAVEVARQNNLPLIGCSDAHYAIQFGTTYSVVEAEEKSIPAIISAIKSGKIQYISKPLSIIRFVIIALLMLKKILYLIFTTERERMKRVFRS
jgi:hypothetical protein